MLKRTLAVPLITASALVAPGTASAEWSAPRTVSAPHAAIGSLRVLEGPFAEYDWRDSLSGDAPVRASAAGPRGEVPAPPAVSGLGRYGAARVIALSQRQVSSLPPQRFAVSASFGSITSGFGAPRALAVAPTANSPQLAVAPDGTALAAWIEIHGRRDIVRVAERPAGGRFGRPRTILGRGQSITVAAAIGPGHDLVVLAVRNHKVVARVHPRHGPWGRVQALATARGGTFWQLAAAVDAGGHVQVAWLRDQLGRSGFPRLRAIEAASAGRDRRFGAVQTLTGELAAQAAPVVLGTPGGWALGYVSATSPGSATAVARVHLRRNGARFGPAIGVSPPAAGLRDLSLAADGSSLLAGWLVPTPPSASGRGLAARMPLGGTFGAAEQVTPDEGVSDIGFAPAPGGTGFTAAWVGRPAGAAGAVVREANGT